MNDEWREILADKMEREAELIMEEVNADPALKDVQAPEEIHDKLMEQIREHEKQKIYEQLSDEDREFMRLGKVYKKHRKANWYLTGVAALVIALAVGTVSMGEGKDISSVISRFFVKRDQIVTGTENTDLSISSKEAEIYEKIEETYGFGPVRMEYLPSGIVFQEGVLGNEIQSANLVYGMDNKANIIYIIRPDYRKNSLGTDIEDKKIQEYQLMVNDVEITMAEYIIEESGEHKWSAHFVYEDVLYMLRIIGIEQEEIEKIVNNLHFYK